MVELSTNVIPLGPWRCKHCGRELLLLTDTNSAPPVRGYVSCVCGAEQYGGADPVALFWRTQDGNWERVREAKARRELLAL